MDFNIEKFIESEMKTMSSFDVIDRLRFLDDEKRKMFLNDERAIEKLRVGLLLESKRDPYYWYRLILQNLSVHEFLSLYDGEFIQKFFISDRSGAEYKLFVCLCEKDINTVIDFVLKDDLLFEEFFKEADNFYSIFSDLEYDKCERIIEKMMIKNKKYDLLFISSISTENQYKLLNSDKISDEMLVSLINNFKIEVQNYFFENDVRAEYLYARFNVNRLLDKGIKFNDNIVRKKDFFEKIKSSSFIVFRENINVAERYLDVTVIEKRLEEYYKEIFDSYLIGKEIFKLYDDILNNPELLFSYRGYYDFIMDEDIYLLFYKYLTQDDSDKLYFENIDELEDELKKKTNRKLSDVVTDALFRDNIYNVWLNIKEMLRYNEGLRDNDKVLDSDKEDFYRFILNIDNVSSDDKMAMYKRLKGMNINLLFYEDLRKLKDISYNKIKEKLVVPSEKEEWIDKEASGKYGTTVYDFRDKNYFLLVRREGRHREKSRYLRGCYSIIASDNNYTFGYDSGDILYGYNTFDNDTVLHVFEGDSASSSYLDEASKRVNRIHTLNDLVYANNSYNELQLVNRKTNDDGIYLTKRPDFIVSTDVIRDNDIEESKRLGIPIVLIKKRKIDIKDRVDVPFRYREDVYVYGSSALENVRNKNRK